MEFSKTHKTVLQSSFVVETVRMSQTTRKLSSSGVPLINLFEGMYADQLHCEEGTVFHPRLVECTHPYCLPKEDECYEPCNEPGCEDWDEDDYYQHCGVPQR